MHTDTRATRKGARQKRTKANAESEKGQKKKCPTEGDRTWRHEIDADDLTMRNRMNLRKGKGRPTANDKSQRQKSFEEGGDNNESHSRSRERGARH